MKNRIKNAINEYLSKNWKRNEAGFFYSDVSYLHSVYENKGIYDAIYDALLSGFMIGYRKGQKDARRR